MRRSWLVTVAVTAVAGWVVAFAVPRDFGVGNYVDDAHYAVLAKALREEGRFATLNLPGTPAENKYPPGFPLLLAASWRTDLPDADALNGLRWVNLALVGPLAAMLALAGIAVFGLPPWLAGAASVVGLFHAQTLSLWVLPLSEPFFLFLTVAGLVAWRAERRGWAFALLVLATWARTVAGAFLLTALVLEGLRARRVTRAMVLAVAALVPWGVWTTLHQGAVPPELVGLFGSYGRWYAWSLRTDVVTLLTQVPWQNLQVTVAELGRRFVSDLVPFLVRAVLGAGALWLLWRGRRERPLVMPALGLYFVIVLLWPFPADRFVAAVWPLVLLALLAAVPARARLLGAVLALAVVTFETARGDHLRFHRGRSARSAVVIGAARVTVPPGLTIASTTPQLHYLHLGNPVVPGQRMRSTRAYRHGFWSTAWGLGDDLWAVAERYRPAYLIVERRGAEGRFAAGSLMRQCPGVLETVWESTEQEYIFRVHSDAPCAPLTTEH